MNFVPPHAAGQYLILDVTLRDRIFVYGAMCPNLPMARRVRDLCAKQYEKHCRVLIVKVVDEFKTVGSYAARRVR